MLSRVAISGGGLGQVRHLFKRSLWNRATICNRDVVGFGMNGGYNYIERHDFPFPAVRFKENTPEAMALREKEKGDWRKLTLEEKKEIYRNSFRTTMSEYWAPTGEWKYILGVTFTITTLCLWWYLTLYVFGRTPLPPTLTDPDRQKAILKRILDLKLNPIYHGVSARWDYENKKFK